MSSDSYNRWGWVTIVSTCALSVVWVLYFMFVQVDVDLDEEREIEIAAMTESVDISKITDYWISSELMVQKGKEIYGQYCSLCHGTTGRGDGIAGRGLKPAPRNFIKGAWKFGGQSKDIYQIISKGSPETSMAAFSHVPKLERWALVHFVRSLSKKRTKDNLEKLKDFALSSN